MLSHYLRRFLPVNNFRSLLLLVCASAVECQNVFFSCQGCRGELNQSFTNFLLLSLLKNFEENSRRGGKKFSTCIIQKPEETPEKLFFEIFQLAQEMKNCC
jgi:hypothetical protein